MGRRQVWNLLKLLCQQSRRLVLESELVLWQRSEFLPVPEAREIGERAA